MKYRHLIGLIVVFLLLLSCGSSGKKTMPADSALEYSGLLRIEEADNYIHARILDPSDSTVQIASYVLIDRNRPQPSSLPDGIVVRVPVESVVIYSSVHAAPLKELGALGIVKGVADAQYFTMPEIAEKIKTGEIEDIGSPASPSLEKLIRMQPDLVIASVYDGANLPDLSRAGVNYLKMADNLESTPLGRAEWIRFLGLITGKRQKADSIFNSVAAEYKKLCNIASGAKEKPTVLTENMYQGIWYVPAGDSYQARMLADAGCRYPWKDTKGTGSLPLAFEEVLEKAGNADIWLYKTFGVELNAGALLKQNTRYRKVKAFGN